MYKLEPAVAMVAGVIMYAPHLDVVSVVAHSTHLRGSSLIENGIEKPNVRVTLAGKICAKDYVRFNLGYLDPATINIDEWKEKEDDGILYVPKAGEILYRLKTK